MTFGNVIRLYCKDCRSDNLAVKRFQVAGVFEHDICCALDLLDCSCITRARGLRHRAVALCKDIQDFMQVFGTDPIRKLLGRFNIRDFEKGIILHAVIFTEGVEFTDKLNLNAVFISDMLSI